MRNVTDIWTNDRGKAAVLDCGLRVLRTEPKPNHFTVKIWKPKAVNPYKHYYFRTWDKREEYIQGQVEAHEAHVASVAERRENRKATPEKLAGVKIGDIFYSSWGYDQTNVDFFQVVKKSKSMLTLREISGKHVPGSGGFMCSQVVAVEDAFVIGSDPFRKQLQFWGESNEPYISMNSYSSASLWDGESKYCSWYA